MDNYKPGDSVVLIKDIYEEDVDLLPSLLESKGQVMVVKRIRGIFDGLPIVVCRREDLNTDRGLCVSEAEIQRSVR